MRYEEALKEGNAANSGGVLTCAQNLKSASPLHAHVVFSSLSLHCYDRPGSAETPPSYLSLPGMMIYAQEEGLWKCVVGEKFVLMNSMVVCGETFLSFPQSSVPLSLF